MRAGLALLVCALACALACGCGDEGADAGIRGDAGSDAGADSDASAATDAGAATDADAGLDAATGATSDPDYADWPIPALPGSGGSHPQRYGIGSALAVDTVTGLVWQRGDAGDLRTHEAALAYCDALVLDGRDDYRLPSRIESISILDPTRSPALDPGAFPDAIAEYHWTSSLAPEAPGSAYSVYLGAGETTLGLVSRPSARVRCVAGGPPAIDPPHFELLDADTARDRGTGLLWSRTALPASTWPEARDACAALGARLPTIRELQSIVDDTRRDPVLDPALFPGARSARHWSSTIRDAGELLPWTLDTLDGQTFAEDAMTARRVAYCVRE